MKRRSRKEQRQDSQEHYGGLAERKHDSLTLDKSAVHQSIGSEVAEE
mgnify:CR=1 FL=1|jgi:hypothetical protein